MTCLEGAVLAAGGVVLVVVLNWLLLKYPRT
jgi:hypothetical protein